jgi:hypothetical protein
MDRLVVVERHASKPIQVRNDARGNEQREQQDINRKPCQAQRTIQPAGSNCDAARIS